MKITVYSANEEGNKELENSILALKSRLKQNNDIQEIKLEELNLKYCTGCWSCWVKTPGKCILKDDMAIIHESFIQSDLVIFAAQMKMGFPSALLKKVTDRLVPLVHPYIQLVNNESHHLPRYDKYPNWGLLLQKEELGSIEDVNLTSEIFERTALNIKSSLLFTYTTDQSINNIYHEIDHI